MKIKNMICFMLVFSMCICTAYASEEKAESGETTIVSTGTLRKDSYTAYQSKFKDKKYGTKSINISVQDLASSEKGKITNDKFGEYSLIEEGGNAEYSVTVSDEGLYALKLDYINVGSDGIRLETEIKIDGEVPFYEASNLNLFSAYKDEYSAGKKRDSNGNDITPGQIEVNLLQSVYIEDCTGVYSEPFLFYFSEGNHKITFSSLRRSIGISKISLCPAPQYKSYDEAYKEYKKQGLEIVGDYYQRIEAENALLKSDSTLIPQADRSSTYTVPYTPSAIKLNIIGGTSWSSCGQWIKYEINVEKDGLYNLALRCRQNAISGFLVTRTLYVNDEIPFDEARYIETEYDMGWQLIEIPYLLHLKEGKNTITLKSSTGKMSSLISSVENSLYRLNYAYRRIVMITGALPDTYRDYRLTETVPEAFEIFKEEKALLKSYDKLLYEMTGERGTMNSVLQSLSQQLNDFIKSPDTIQKRLDAFKSNISALGNWLVVSKQQILDLDSIFVYSDKASIPKIEAGFFGYLAHELTSFLYSFVNDYSLVGDTFGKEAIDVWVQTGRDQANVIKELIINDFDPNYGIDVNLKLVQGQLLPATVAGKGPDIVLQARSSDPVNYAIRGAVTALSDFKDFPQIEKQFRKSALTAFYFDGKYYALPETQTFNVMFYRKDILDELEIAIPKTWNEFFKAVGILQKNNMTVGVQPPSSILGASNGLSSMGMFLYQKGGSFYTEDGSASMLSDNSAIEAFKTWVSLYTDYGLPVRYDALTRFRTGEMPIVIEDYTLFNTLSVAAPEIKGLWGFTSVPATVSSEGKYNNSVTGAGLAVMLLNTREEKQQLGWNFIKWWVGAETQYKYGIAIENKLGVSARYPTANTEAFAKLPWPSAEYKILTGQWENVKGIPEVAGGYFTSRNINNAFRRVVTYGEDSKETLLGYVNKIDGEIISKRQELGIA